MDPQVTLESAETALEEHDYKTVRELLNTYAEWRNNGGFEPSGGDDIFEELVHDYECEYKAYKGARINV